MIIIGYSGHAFVVYAILSAAGKKVIGYCDESIKEKNPFNLSYFGSETSETAISKLSSHSFFISIGNNKIRSKVYYDLHKKGLLPVNAVHPSAIIDTTVKIQSNGTMIAAGVIINPLVTIGNGVICNTGCVIEHECVVEDFAHIGPGAILCGNVHVGQYTFIGAGAVVKQGIKIGSNVIVGAGAVVVKNINDGVVVKGCPAR